MTLAELASACLPDLGAERAHLAGLLAARASSSRAALSKLARSAAGKLPARTWPAALCWTGPDPGSCT